MKILTFIFNWRGQYDKTIEKVNQLREIGVEPIVINSDDDHKDYDWHNIGEDSYFTAQFMKALELFHKFKGDVLFHIQGDASYDNWKQLYADAEKYYETYEWGIYAPNVDYTWYDSSKVDLQFNIDEPNLKMVADTDCTCWFIHKDIIDLFKKENLDFSKYKYGWSWDVTLCSISYINKRLVIRDYGHTINHPQGTGYNMQEAEMEMVDTYNSLNPNIQEAFRFIKGNYNYLAKYFI
jgi:hypothetical protein